MDNTVVNKTKNKINWIMIPFRSFNWISQSNWVKLLVSPLTCPPEQSSWKILQSYPGLI